MSNLLLMKSPPKLLKRFAVNEDASSTANPCINDALPNIYSARHETFSGKKIFGYEYFISQISSSSHHMNN